MSLRKVSTLAGTALALCASGASTAAAGSIDYVAAWRIAPNNQIEPPKWVKPGETFAEAKLVPVMLVVTQSPMLDKTGRTILPAGSNLIQLVARQTIACTINPSAVKLSLAHWSSPVRHICLMDSSRSGRFDKLYRVPGKTTTMFGAGTLPDEGEVITPVTYAKADPDQSSVSIPVKIKYKNFASFVDKLVMEVCITPQAIFATGCLFPTIGVKRSAIPVEFSIFGGRFKVDAKAGSRVSVSMLKQLDPEPLLIDGS